MKWIGYVVVVGEMLCSQMAAASPYNATQLKAKLRTFNKPPAADAPDSTVSAMKMSLGGPGVSRKGNVITVRGDALAKLGSALVRWRAVEQEFREADAERSVARGTWSIESPQMGKQLNRIARMDDVEFDAASRSVIGRDKNGLTRTAQVDGEITSSSPDGTQSVRSWGRSDVANIYVIGDNRLPTAFKKAQTAYLAEKSAKPNAAGAVAVARTGDVVESHRINGRTTYVVSRAGRQIALFPGNQGGSETP